MYDGNYKDFSLQGCEAVYSITHVSENALHESAGSMFLWNVVKYSPQ